MSVRTGDKIVSCRFEEHVPCAFHFHTRKTCNKGNNCRFSHNPDDYNRFPNVCPHFSECKYIDTNCSKDHEQYPISEYVLQEARDYVDAGLPTGNYVAALKSGMTNHGQEYGKLDQWFKFNLRPEEDEMMIELRKDSQAVMRFELKASGWPSDLFDYVSADDIEKVFALGDGDVADCTTPSVIRQPEDGREDGIDRGVWRVRVDHIGPQRKNVGIEFMCIFKTDNAAEPCEQYDESDEYCMRYIIKFQLNNKDWKKIGDDVHAGRRLTGRYGSGITLAQWLNFDDLRVYFPHYAQWTNMLRSDLGDCLDVWDAFLEQSDWKLTFTGHDDPPENELVPLTDVAAHFANL